MRPGFFKMGFVFIGVDLLLVLIVFIRKGSEYVSFNHHHRFFQKLFGQKQVPSRAFVKHVDQLYQGFSLFLPELSVFGVLFRVRVEVGSFVAVQ